MRLDPAAFPAGSSFVCTRVAPGVAGARVAAGGTRQRLILWRSSLRYDFAKRLGLGTAPYNSLRAFGSSLKQVRRVSYEALRARPQAKPLRRHRNRRRRVPPAAPREGWYSTGWRANSGGCKFACGWAMPRNQAMRLR